MKKCRKCGEFKPLDNYNRHNGKEHGHPNCKACRREYTREFRRLNADKEKIRCKNMHLVKKYGISLETYNALIMAQENKCVICDCEFSGKHNHICVDHNHKTGQVRGIICRACNSGLGNFKDSPSTIEKAKQYLLKRGYFGK